MDRLDIGKVDEALAVLDAIEKQLCGEVSPCLDDSCSNTAMETVEKVKMVLVIYQGLKERLEVTGFDVPSQGSGNATCTPEGIEAVLSPLSNKWRLRILWMLRESDRTLSEISKALDMRTGHMQFHINSLRDAGYILSDKRTRTYKITDKGERALRGAERLAAGL
jgi:DNA-binding transcriptional ArsR family regulator